MKVKSRIISMFLFLALAAACFTGLIATHAFTAKADSTLPTTSSFETLNEAEIRQVDPYGIRFTTRISSDEYKGLIEYYGEENVKFGTLIGRGTSYDALKASGEKVERSKWVSGYDPSTASASEYRYSLAIVGLKDANLNSYYIALGYVEITDTVTNPGEPTTKTVYAIVQNDFKRTPLQVASAYVKDLVAGGELDVEDEQHQYLLNIVDEVIDGETVKPTFAEETFTVKCLETATPQVTVGGVPVSATYSVEPSTTVAEVQNGAIYAKNAGSTTITATIKGLTQDYTCTATLNVEKNVTTPGVNKDGTLTLATGGALTTVSVDGKIAQENVTADTFNVVEYILTNKAPTETTTYDITVESANATGATTHTLVPLTNENFITNLRLGQEDCKGKTFFLAEDIVLNPWTPSSNGDFSQRYLGYFAGAKETYININGMGRSIRYSVNPAAGSNDNVRLRGFAYNLYGYWQNIHFDITASLTVCSGLVACELMDGSAITNCYFDIELDPARHTGYGCLTAIGKVYSMNVNIKNNVINYSTISDGVYYAVEGVGGSLYYNIDDIVAIGNDTYLEPIQSINTGTNLMSSASLDFYPTVNDFLNKTNGTNYVKTSGISAYETPTSITDADYSDWSKWTFDSVNGTIKLCGETVYDANATKKTANASVDANAEITLGTNGQFTNIYVVDGDDETLITSNALHSYNLKAYAAEQGWATAAGTTVTLKVESKDYVGTVSHTFTALALTLTADDKGVITFDVGSEVATVKVNGNVVDGATASPFDLSAYHFASANANSSVEYTVVVTSNSYYGELTYNFVALTQANFISTLRASDVTIATATGGDATGRTFFLAENITLSWANSTLNTIAGDCKAILAGASTGLYANLDGRGKTIQVTYDITSGNNRASGMIGWLYGLWYNVVFDFSIPQSNSKEWQCLLAYGIPTSGHGFEDCYFKVTTGTNTPSAVLIYGLGLGHIKNCIFDFNATTGNNIFVTQRWEGTHGVRKLLDCAIIDNTVDQASSVMANEGTGSSNIGWIDVVNTYRYRNIENGYTAKQAFFNSGACSLVKTTGANTASAIKPTDVAAGSSITTLITWGSAWEFTSNTVKLCGTTVLSANA